MIQNQIQFLKSLPLLSIAVLVLHGCGSDSVPDNEPFEPLEIYEQDDADSFITAFKRNS